MGPVRIETAAGSHRILQFLLNYRPTSDKPTLNYFFYVSYKKSKKKWLSNSSSRLTSSHGY